MRFKQTLAGSWQFHLDPGGLIHVDNRTADRVIRVLRPGQAAFAELGNDNGYTPFEFAVGSTLRDEFRSARILGLNRLRRNALVSNLHDGLLALSRTRWLRDLE